MTVQDVVIDHSEQFTPADIIARGHDDPWTGIAIRQATMYFPRETPLLGDFTVGVRDVLLGSPLGIQGEVNVEWGDDPLLDATMVEFFQQKFDANGQSIDVAMPIDSGVRVRAVNFEEDSGGVVRVRARVPTLPPDRECEWYIPGVIEPITSAGTPYFNVTDEDVVALHFTILRDGKRIRGPMITFIIREATNETERAPRIRLEKGTAGWDNVIYVGGNANDLNDMVLKATPVSGTTLSWTVEGAHGGQAGNEFAVPVMPDIGVYDIILTDNKQHQRRIRIDVLADDDEVLIGHEGGHVSRLGGLPPKILAVDKTFELKKFYENGTQKTFDGDDAVVDRTGTILDVPAGAIAEVTVEAKPVLDPGDPANGMEKPAEEQLAKHVQVLFGDTAPHLPDTLNILEWGRASGPKVDIGDGETPSVVAGLQAWVQKFDSATTKYLLIGRCDDRYFNNHNGLARGRADVVRQILEGAGIDEDRIYMRAELEPLIEKIRV